MGVPLEVPRSGILSQSRGISDGLVLAVTDEEGERRVIHDEEVFLPVSGRVIDPPRPFSAKRLAVTREISMRKLPMRLVAAKPYNIIRQVKRPIRGRIEAHTECW